MKRNPFKRGLCVFLAFLCLSNGCGRDSSGTDGDSVENTEREVTLTWVYFSAYGEIAEETLAELNRLLQENYHCNFTVALEPIGVEEVRDVTDYKRLLRERYESKEATDILYTGTSYMGEVPAYDQAVQDGMLLPLTSMLMETESGQRLYHAFSEAYWTTMQYEGDIYGFRTVDEQLVYDSVWMANQRYAPGFSEGKTFSLSDVKPALEELAAGNAVTAGICGLYADPTALCSIEGYFPVCYGFPGLYFVQENGQFHAVSAAEEERLTEDWRIIRECRELCGDLSADPFQQFVNGEFIFAIQSCNLKNLYDGRFLYNTVLTDVGVLCSRPQAAIYALNAVTGIASWSEHPEEALEFLGLVATEPELSNLLTYGIEGTHYQVDPATGHLVIAQIGGLGPYVQTTIANKMITLPTELEPENKTEIYAERNESVAFSPEVLYELHTLYSDPDIMAILDIYAKYGGLWDGDYEDVDQTVAQLQRELEEAGIEEVLNKLNQLLL
ncbi:MAG: ABC transporter substrate-binding protein [bacterium]|nr:ABC transporter substrate-binding protein [bacterium]